eukprot:Pgem_evm1s19650
MDVDEKKVDDDDDDDDDEEDFCDFIFNNVTCSNIKKVKENFCSNHSDYFDNLEKSTDEEEESDSDDEEEESDSSSESDLSFSSLESDSSS